YNAYLSFDSKWILSRALQRDSPIVSADRAETVADLLTNQAIQDWASSRMRRSNFWVFACQWMTCPCWVLSRSLFFLCGSCSSLAAKITPSDPCYAIPTQVVTMMSLIGILQCRNGKSRTRTVSGG